jgi:hypothetical protein
MTFFYSTTTIPGTLRTVHTIVIEHKQLSSTRAKDILIWAKPRIFDKHTWKEVKAAVRLGTSLQVCGGGLFE